MKHTLPTNRIAAIIGALLLFGSMTAAAQRAEFRLGAVNKTPIGTNEAYMTLGADVGATIGLDTALGEREIPAIPLPGDIFYMWTVVRLNADEVWFNPKDLRPLRNERYVDSVDLRVQWTGGSLQFVSPGMKPAYIDSAYVIDAVLDFPNNVFKYKLWSGNDGTTNNPAITKFRLLVWYNGTGASVAADLPTGVVLGPVPFNDMLRIQHQGAMQHLRLIDMQGREAISVVMNDGATAVATSHLAAGPYIVELTDAAGMRYRRIIVRQ